MAKYVNETGTQTQQKHVDLYKLSVCLSCYYFSHMSFICLGESDFDKRNECTNANGNTTSLIAYNGLT
jgi:hypothetical protein